MGHAVMVKYLIWGVLLFNVIALVPGCGEEEQKKMGQEITRDSPGWERLRQQDALPPEKRDRGGPPKGPVSSEW